MADGIIRRLPLGECPWCKAHRQQLTEEQRRAQDEALGKLKSQWKEEKKNEESHERKILPRSNQSDPNRDRGGQKQGVARVTDREEAPAELKRDS